MACKFWGIVFSKIYGFWGSISDVGWYTPVTRLLKLPPGSLCQGQILKQAIFWEMISLLLKYSLCLACTQPLELRRWPLINPFILLACTQPQATFFTNQERLGPKINRYSNFEKVVISRGGGGVAVHPPVENFVIVNLLSARHWIVLYALCISGSASEACNPSIELNCSQTVHSIHWLSLTHQHKAIKDCKQWNLYSWPAKLRKHHRRPLKMWMANSCVVHTKTANKRLYRCNILSTECVYRRLMTFPKGNNPDSFFCTEYIVEDSLIWDNVTLYLVCNCNISTCNSLHLALIAEQDFSLRIPFLLRHIFRWKFSRYGTVTLSLMQYIHLIQIF